MGLFFCVKIVLMLKANFAYIILGFLLLTVLVFSVFAQTDEEPLSRGVAVLGDIKVEICGNRQVSTLVRKESGELVYECVGISTYRICQGLGDTSPTKIAPSEGEESWRCITDTPTCGEDEYLVSINNDNTINCLPLDVHLVCGEGQVVAASGDGTPTCVDSGLSLPENCPEINNVVAFDGNKWSCVEARFDQSDTDVEGCFIKVGEGGEVLTQVRCGKTEESVTLRVEPNRGEDGVQEIGKKVFGNLIYSGSGAKNIDLKPFAGNYSIAIPQSTVSDTLARAIELYPADVPCGLGANGKNITPCFDKFPGHSGNSDEAEHCPTGFDYFNGEYKYCVKSETSASGSTNTVNTPLTVLNCPTGSSFDTSSGECFQCGFGNTGFSDSTRSQCGACNLDYTPSGFLVGVSSAPTLVDGDVCSCPSGQKLNEVGYCRTIGETSTEPSSTPAPTVRSCEADNAVLRSGVCQSCGNGRVPVNNNCVSGNPN